MFLALGASIINRSSLSLLCFNERMEGSLVAGWVWRSLGFHATMHFISRVIQLNSGVCTEEKGSWGNSSLPSQPLCYGHQTKDLGEFRGKEQYPSQILRHPPWHLLLHHSWNNVWDPLNTASAGAGDCGLLRTPSKRQSPCSTPSSLPCNMQQMGCLPAYLHAEALLSSPVSLLWSGCIESLFNS